MRIRQFFIPTTRHIPAEAELISHRLMLRAGLIRQVASGIYNWLPLGLRAVRKIEKIVREEMEAIGAVEIMMPVIQPGELWRESKRWDEYGAELFRLNDRHGREFCLGPTHEEIITDFIRRNIDSYRQLPLTLYQIQTKLRDEVRPRFGIMRSREFLMKDAYSFHLSTADLEKTYWDMHGAYSKIFQRIGLQYRVVRAAGGNIGGNFSHEFHILAKTGEDRIAYSDSSDYAVNVDLFRDSPTPIVDGAPSPDGQGTLSISRGIEVGHIFQLGQKYSASMNAAVQDADGKKQFLWMGCYGIGISRILAAAIEQLSDGERISWPEAIAPFSVTLIALDIHREAQVKKAVEDIYHQLLPHTSILLDDSEERPGVKFANMELIGIPHRVIISRRTMDKGVVEYQSLTGKVQKIPLSDITQYLLDQLQ